MNVRPLRFLAQLGLRWYRGPTRPVVRYIPVARNDNLRGLEAIDVLVFRAAKDDFDSAEDAPCHVVRGGSLSALFIAMRIRAAVLEVPEPLWSREWPRCVPMLVAARILLRRRVLVAAYAIENCPVRERLTVPVLDATPTYGRWATSLAISLWRLTIPLLDAIAFGTPQAMVNYENAFRRKLKRMATRVIADRLPTCRACPWTDWDERGKTVTFLGEVSYRKGIDLLIQAWTFVGSNEPNATLNLVGADRLTEAPTALPASVHSWGLVKRNEVHALLAHSRVVVLPSRAVPRWREQVGISLIEGEAHGCRLVASRDSGIAGSLAERSKALVVDSEDVGALGAAIVMALNDPFSPCMHPQDSRHEVRGWFVAVARSRICRPTEWVRP